MILGFKQQFPWKEPTYFREKILYGVGRAIWLTPRQIKKFAKIHTMREDPHNRWKVDMSIQMVYRGPKYSILDHFNEGIPELEVCTGVQKIDIFYDNKNGILADNFVDVVIDGESFEYVRFNSKGEPFYDLGEGKKIKTLAANDGFDSVIDFFKWFDRDWSGKIIHWSNFRY